MVTNYPASSVLISTIIISSIIFTLPSLIKSQNDSTYYDQCSPFKCGNITFSFPFSSFLTFGLGPQDCGPPGYQISCDEYSSSSSPGQLMLPTRQYQVKDLYLSELLITVVDTLAIKDLSSGSCDSLRNFSISSAYKDPLSLPPWTANLTFFKCHQGLTLSKEFLDKVVVNYSCNEGYQLYLWRNGNQDDPPIISPALTPSGCHLVMVPVSSTSLVFFNVSGGGGDHWTELFHVLADGFPLIWPRFNQCESCIATDGRCGFDGTLGEIVCFCRGGCQHVKHKTLNKQELIIGVAIGSSCFVLLIVVLLLIFRKRISPIFKTFYFKRKQITEEGINADQFIKTYRSTLFTNYSYNDIKKMTNGFKEKLGEGGYGNVYKGKLLDGRLVAVKMLDKSNNIGNDFINEVSTIGRIHHVNVINLLGFCWDGSRQALIYEYMSNGSLGDILSKEEANLSLGLARLLEIAIGVAYGVEYLHNGCESRILHLDIKPQNVLLDQNFNPKISDFGLAKIYSRNRSVVTMTGARGTIGYIAPEIFMRNIGNPSNKSDVYSYGMLLLQMLGRREHFEPLTSTSSEAYFPSWVHDKLIEETDMEQTDYVLEEEAYITKKMVMVGLWCIQINPRDRPSMTRVVEMLSGNVEAIEMPPKPSFLPSPRVQFENEITSGDSDNSVLPLTSDSHEM